jgi:hypothetical protein
MRILRRRSSYINYILPRQPRTSTKKLLVDVDGCFAETPGHRNIAAQPFKLNAVWTRGKKEKVYLSGKSMNSLRAWSPPASGVEAAAVLISTKEAFFIGLFTAATFVTGFLGV